MAETPVWEPVVAYDRTFDARYGLELLEHDAEAGEVRGRVAVRPELLTEHGLPSTGTALAVMGNGDAAMGLSNDTTVLADVREGTVHAHARAVHRGEREWVWTVDATDDRQRPVAHSRVTVAVRPLRRPA